MHLDLAPEQEQFRGVVREFARAEVAPYAEEWDREHTFPVKTVLALGAFGLTEAGGGSDAGATVTKAALDGGEWVIDGQKSFITNSGTAITKCVTITARTGPGEISNLVVDAGTPGFDVLPPYRKMG